MVEDADTEPGSPLLESLRHAGFAVAVCPGPRAGGSATRCPLVEHGECPLVEGADVVVWGLGLERRESREELAALKARHPRLTVVVRAPAEDVSRWVELVEGSTVVDPALPVEAVVEAVIEAARSATSRAL